MLYQSCTNCNDQALYQLRIQSIWINTYSDPPCVSLLHRLKSYVRAWAFEDHQTTILQPTLLSIFAEAKPIEQLSLHLPKYWWLRKNNWYLIHLENVNHEQNSWKSSYLPWCTCIKHGNKGLSYSPVHIIALNDFESIVSYHTIVMIRPWSIRSPLLLLERTIASPCMNLYDSLRGW